MSYSTVLTKCWDRQALANSADTDHIPQTVASDLGQQSATNPAVYRQSGVTGLFQILRQVRV